MPDLCDNESSALSNTINSNADTASPLRQKRAREYDRLHNWLFLVDLALMAVLLVVLMWGGSRGLSFTIQRFVSAHISNNPWAVTAGYIAILACGYTAVFLPYSWWKGFYIEHRYELSNQSFFSWIWDEIKSFALTLILASIVFEIFYALLRVAGTAWWIWAACAWVILQVLLGMVFPVLILPLFYKKETRLTQNEKQLYNHSTYQQSKIFRVDEYP